MNSQRKELAYYDPNPAYYHKDITPIRHRHLFIGGPLAGELLSEQEYFDQEERGYQRYNSSFRHNSVKAVWVHRDIFS